MNKYKLICLDIDGTLLNSSHQITKKTKEIITKAISIKNIPVILVSARMPKGIVFLLKELGINEPIICYSGALVLARDLTILHNNYIPVDLIKQVYENIKDFYVNISLYKNDEWYIERMDEWALQEKTITNIVPNIVPFEDLFKSLENKNEGFNKVLIMGDSEIIKYLNTKISEIFQDNLNIYKSKPTYLEIMDKHTSKVNAIKLILQKYNVSKNELIAIGDNFNDISMIEFAGMGIAMGNAPEDIKSLADYTTLTNDEDGVAYAIEKFILN